MTRLPHADAHEHHRDTDPVPPAQQLAAGQHAEQHAGHGVQQLTEGEFDILATRRRTGAPFALAPSALVDVTMVTKGAVSKRVDALEAKGLVVRESVEHDGRARLVRLTEAGLALIDEAVAAHLDNERRILAALPARDRVELERILAAWAARYELES